MTTDAQAAASTTPSLEQVHASAEAAGRVLPCSRRALLRRAGAGTAVVGAAGLLAACGGTSEPDATGGAAGGDAGASAGGGASVPASEVPEGSAVVVQAGGGEVVLAQPAAGQYVAFSAVCTHAGGIVRATSGTQVTCPLHNSVFDAGDGGAVLEGPATEPLEALQVALEGDQLVIS